MKPSIAVVIVNWNSREDVLAALASLRDQTDPDVEIAVVDNGSTDGSATAIRAEFPGVRVLETGDNLGFAEGCNRGIDATRSDWVFLFNNDAVAEPSCIAELRQAAVQAAPEVGTLQPLIVFATRPTHVNSSGVIVFRTGAAHDRHFAEPVEATESAGDPVCATAGAALYRRSMLERVRLAKGYLDPDFFVYFEDVDLGWRCRLAGYETKFVRSARVRHRFRGSSTRLGNAFVRTQFRVNRIAMLVHNASLSFILRSSVVSTLEMASTVREVGLRPAAGLARRLPRMLQDRWRIGRFSRVPRREVERRWMSLAPVPPPEIDLAERHD